MRTTEQGRSPGRRTRRWLLAVATMALALSGCQAGNDSGKQHIKGFADSVPLPAGSPPAHSRRPTRSSHPARSRGQEADAGALDRVAATARQQVGPIIGTNGMYSAINVIARHPDGLELEYILHRTSPMTQAEANIYFAGQMAKLQAVTDDNVAPGLRRIGIERPWLTFTYRNPDHSLIWTHRFRAH